MKMAPSATRPGVTTALAAFASVSAIVGTIHYLDIPSMLAQRTKTCRVDKSRYSTDDTYSLTAFKALVEQLTLQSTYPLASDIQKNIPIYECAKFDLRNEKVVEKLKDELFHVLYHGPGVFVLKGFYAELSTINTANAAFDAIIAREKEENGAKGDHFAPASANSRIWNAFSKHCHQDASSFFEYYSNPFLRLVSEAYLGPDYKITTQVNVVKPGGQAQVCHRDYHLGFQTTEAVARWPKPMHDASRLLTLQGAVAHTDMHLDSGPTRLLPYSQLFEEGFMAYRKEEFHQYFLANYVALPLKKGDGLFFSPALFHAAGENTTRSFDRSANLIQVSSAFGKTMETIDSLPLIAETWDMLKKRYNAEGMSGKVDAFVRAVAEGYPFPTNLDRRPPAPGGMAPESEQDVLRRGLSEDCSKYRVVEELTEMRKTSQA